MQALKKSKTVVNTVNMTEIWKTAGGFVWRYAHEKNR